MKALIVTIFLALTGSCIHAQENFTLKGKLANFKGTGKIMLGYRTGDVYKQDSTTIKDGVFNYTGKLEAPGMVSIGLRTAEKSTGGRPDRTALFISPGEKVMLNGKDSLKNATVSGSPTNDQFKNLNQQLEPVNKKMEVLYNKYDVVYKAKDTAAIKQAKKEIEDLEAGEMADTYKKFISENNASPVALHALERMAGYDLDVAKAEPYWNMLAASIRDGKNGKSFEEKMDIARKTQVGKPAMEFTQNDPDGKPVKLSDFKGQYVLIDFWASWCGPCRAENPNVVEAYKKFKDKKFTVLGISLDREGQKDRWLKAIADDGLTWAHVSDLKFWNNAIAMQYGIKAIPQNLLVGPDGIIVARNLREEKLHETLKKLLGE
jgi:peroxiredoxin